MTQASILEQIQTLDPERDHQRIVFLSLTSADSNHHPGVARNGSERACRTKRSTGFRASPSRRPAASSSWSQAVQQNLPEWAAQF
jgi:hypothetical protein